MGALLKLNEPDKLSLLLNTVQDLSMARTLDEVMALVRTTARNLTGADGATFVLRDGDRCHYADEDAIAPLWKGGKFPMSLCISGWVMLNKQSVVIKDIYADPRIPADAYRPTFVKSLAMVPIRTKNPIGAIGNYWASPHEASMEEVHLLRALADSASIAMENVQLLQGLEKKVRDRTAELEAFTYSVSHDLRAPLRGISGFLQIIEEDYKSFLPQDGQELIDRVLRSANHMSHLIEALLELSRINRTPFDLCDVNLSKMTREIYGELHREDPERQIELLASDSPSAFGDYRMLRIVLTK